MGIYAGSQGRGNTSRKRKLLPTLILTVFKLTEINFNVLGAHTHRFWDVIEILHACMSYWTKQLLLQIKQSNKAKNAPDSEPVSTETIQSDLHDMQTKV